MIIKFLIEKEFKQIVRNKFLPKLIVFMPCMMLLVMPWVATYDVRNINVCIIDNDHSAYSQRLVHKIEASVYFHLTALANTYDEALDKIETGTADLVLEVQPDFERNLMRDGNAQVMLAVNSVNGTKAGLGSSYLMAIVRDFSDDIRGEQIQAVGNSVVPTISIVSQNRFNPHLNYKLFMVPALMVMLMTLLSGFLPALNIVGEKEVGTIEQMNVTPVSKFTFIMAKLIPYWIIGYIVLTIGLIIATAAYGLMPVGSLLTIYFFATVYIIAVSGMGLLVSNYSDTMQQAMFVVFFFMMILILMSGLFTPVSSMPHWAQVITIFNPLKYFMQVMRMVYLKGSGIMELIPQLLALCGFALVLNTWAVISYRKSS